MHATVYWLEVSVYVIFHQEFGHSIVSQVRQHDLILDYILDRI